MSHPLTDEILGQQFNGIETASFYEPPYASIYDYLSDENGLLFDEQAMRLAYDMGVKAGRKEWANG